MDAWRLKSVANAVNLSTPVGLLVAVGGRSRLRRGPRGLLLASDFSVWAPSWVRRAGPRARLRELRIPPAFTLGNVVLSPLPAEYLDSRPALLAHEERHSWQYAVCLGLPMLPLYAAGAAWSWVRGGDLGVHNPFERLAGLADGGYPLLSARDRRAERRPQPAG